MSVFSDNVTNELPADVVSEQRCKELANLLADKLFHHPEEFRPVVIQDGNATGLSRDPSDIFYRYYKSALWQENISKYERFWFGIPSMCLVKENTTTCTHFIECPIEYMEDGGTYTYSSNTHSSRKKLTQMIEFEIELPRYINMMDRTSYV